MDNEFENWIASVSHNYWLCYKYPWLIPHNRWTDEEVEDFDFSYTELDGMPDGWRKAFGEQMCEEIQKLLEEADWVYKYRVFQIKEKWGYLHWYDGAVPEFIRERLNTIIQKYEDLSKKICIKCGAPATKISIGWISPWCDKCAEEIRDSCVPIDEWLKEQKTSFAERFHWISIEPFGH